MTTQLTGAHLTTYNAVLQHPVTRKLEWRNVWSMLTALADVVQNHGQTLKVTRNARTLVLQRPYRKGLDDVQELMKIRQFLESSGAVLPPPPAEGVHLLVVIDHRMARIYTADLHGSVPQRIVPYESNGSGRHLHYVQDDSNGQRKPERKSFYEQVAKTLQNAQQILLFGSGTGASSAMEQLHAELKHHHAQIAKRVVGAIVVNEQHLTESQLLAKAREFYANQKLEGA